MKGADGKVVTEALRRVILCSFTLGWGAMQGWWGPWSIPAGVWGWGWGSGLPAIDRQGL